MLRGTAIVVLVLLAGCDRVFGILDLDPAARADARESGDAVSLGDGTLDGAGCASGSIADDFSGSGEACGTWGVADSAMVTRSSGLLHMPLDPRALSGCTVVSPIPFTSGGVELEVTAVFPDSGSYTELKLRDPGGGRPDLLLLWDGALELMEGTNVVASQGSAPPWWRLRNLGGFGVAELSEDGVTWTPFGNPIAGAPSQVQIDLGAGSNGTLISSSEATFSTFRVCE